MTVLYTAVKCWRCFRPKQKKPRQKQGKVNNANKVYLQHSGNVALASNLGLACILLMVQLRLPTEFFTVIIRCTEQTHWFILQKKTQPLRKQGFTDEFLLIVFPLCLSGGHNSNQTYDDIMHLLVISIVMRTFDSPQHFHQITQSTPVVVISYRTVILLYPDLLQKISPAKCSTWKLIAD